MGDHVVEVADLGRVQRHHVGLFQAQVAQSQRLGAGRALGDRQLRQVDAETGKPLVEVIVDAAGMKGTGTWTVQEALNLGVPAAAIAESVFARALSSSPELRKAAQAALEGPDGKVQVDDVTGFIEDVRQALWCTKVVAYAQGLHLIKVAGQEYGWDIDVAACVCIW